MALATQYYIFDDVKNGNVAMLKKQRELEGVQAQYDQAMTEKQVNIASLVFALQHPETKL